MAEVNRKLRDVPEDLKSLRACLFCSMIKSQEQFEKYGCTNCEFLGLKSNRQKVIECTSANFEGVISMMDTEGSWVARWQRIAGKQYNQGLYAVSVSGRLPRHVQEDIQREFGKKYIPRSQ